VADPVAGGDIGGEFVVAAAEVLHEGVPGGQGPRGPAAFQSAHRPQPGLQPAVIGLDRIVGIALDGVLWEREGRRQAVRNSVRFVIKGIKS